MSYSEREKQIAELRRQMMILEEENRIEREKQEKAERASLMEKRREEGLPEVHHLTHSMTGWQLISLICVN